MTNIREKEGGTYGVGVQAGSSKEPYESYSMTMSFDCDPDKAEHLKSLIYAEIDKLMKEGPTQEEIDKVTTILKKNNEQSKPHNAYWMSAIQTYYLRGIDVTDPKNFDNIIDKITTKDVKKFTQKLFKGADVVDMIFQTEIKIKLGCNLYKRKRPGVIPGRFSFIQNFKLFLFHHAICLKLKLFRHSKNNFFHFRGTKQLFGLKEHTDDEQHIFSR